MTDLISGEDIKWKIRIYESLATTDGSQILRREESSLAQSIE